MYHKCQIGNADAPGKKRDISHGEFLCSWGCDRTERINLGQKGLTWGVPSLSLPHSIKGVLVLSPGIFPPLLVPLPTPGRALMLSDQLFGCWDTGSGKIGGKIWKICSSGVGVRAGDLAGRRHQGSQILYGER